MAEKLNLRQKLASIYTTISHIDKYGENTSQRYHYVRAADVLHAVRKALADLKVYAATNYTLLGTYDIKTNKGGIMHTATVRADITFMDTESDETISVSGLGDGADSGDKGIYKAQTGATKNALRNAALVPDEADPEADQTVDTATSGQYEEPAPPAPIPIRRPAGKTTGMNSSGQFEIPAEVPAANIPADLDEIPQSGNQQAEVPAPAPTRKRGETAASPVMPAEGGSLPTDAQLNSFRTRQLKLGDDLAAAGLKASRGPSGVINRKTLSYLLQVTGQEDALKITTTQWEAYFQFVDKMMSLENGPQQLVKLVNESAAKG